jgi:hypothetical protein
MRWKGQTHECFVGYTANEFGKIQIGQMIAFATETIWIFCSVLERDSQCRCVAGLAAHAASFYRRNQQHVLDDQETDFGTV